MKNLSALTKSLIFHGIIVVFVSGAFLFKDDTLTVTETPIEVSFINEEPAARDEEKKPEPVEEAPPPIEEKPQPAPKALEQPKPKPAPKAEEAKEEPVETIEAKPLEKSKPAPDPSPKPKPPEKKPEPKPEPKEKPKEPEDEAASTDFMSVLKNLQDSEPVNTNAGADQDDTPEGRAVTSGEINALTQQLAGCWSLLPGAAQAETLAVRLTINVNRDRTVRNVMVEDRGRYQSDPFFRAAADNAMRAIKHPNCTPLDLPPEKYNMWKEMTLNFDPQKMF
jgi:hypothetical protein